MKRLCGGTGMARGVPGPLRPDASFQGAKPLRTRLRRRPRGTGRMCGIAGIINKRGKLSRDRLGQLAEGMADRMSYRGPDDSGVWVSPDGRCALSPRPLSIIDTSSAGHQPMASNSGRSVISFNGEIYNYLELKSE